MLLCNMLFKNIFIWEGHRGQGKKYFWIQHLNISQYNQCLLRENKIISQNIFFQVIGANNRETIWHHARVTKSEKGIMHSSKRHFLRYSIITRWKRCHMTHAGYAWALQCFSLFAAACCWRINEIEPKQDTRHNMKTTRQKTLKQTKGSTEWSY